MLHDDGLILAQTLLPRRSPHPAHCVRPLSFRRGEPPTGGGVRYPNGSLRETQWPRASRLSITKWKVDYPEPMASLSQWDPYGMGKGPLWGKSQISNFKMKNGDQPPTATANCYWMLDGIPPEVALDANCLMPGPPTRLVPAHREGFCRIHPNGSRLALRGSVRRSPIDEKKLT